MEQKSMVSLRKNEARTLLKKCFGKNIFSLVPFEIWRDVLCEAEGIVLCRLAQTCWGFKELVDNLRELILEYALKYRREDKIPQAKNLIMRCAKVGNSRAMFHVGHAYFTSGWGLRKDKKKSVEWFRKAASSGHGPGMAFYARFLFDAKEVDLAIIWAKKVLSSNDPFAAGYCQFLGYGMPRDSKRSFERFALSAEEGDEYGQRWLAVCFENGFGVDVDKEKAFHWYLKSAEQGLALSQRRVSDAYYQGKGCERNEELSRKWNKKALNQEY